MRIAVQYEETDVAQALSKIIKDPNAQEFVKLISPMICSSSTAVDHFFKLMIGNKLWEPIPTGTLCRLSIDNLGYSVDKELTRQKIANIDDKIVVTVKDFRGYHDYSAYTVEFTAVDKNGLPKTDYTYVNHADLEVIEEF